MRSQSGLAVICGMVFALQGSAAGAARATADELSPVERFENGKTPIQGIEKALAQDILAKL
jgi:hypothetical protein